MIPQDIIERVRAETDIVGLIGEYVKLKRSGKSFVGLCPFHQEKTPSFNVSPDRQAYYCFGCGAGGNAITFLMNYENVSFPEAVKRLAERLGIRIQYTAEDDPTKPLVQALELAHKIYKDTLWSTQGTDAQHYLADRGLKKETVKEFGLGLVPQDTSPILSAAREAKLSTQVLKDAGVLSSTAGRLYPFLSGRIVFPIWSASGKLVGFSGRVWGDDPNPAKYVNTPETKLFKKSWLLYGLHKARPYLRREGALLVEGQMDVLRLAQSGFHNTVAPLGTAFTTQQAKVLSRYTDKVILVFDGDEPGQKAAVRALGEVLAVDLDARLLILPEGEDPDSYLSSYSPDDFKSLLEHAEESMPFVYNLASPSTAAQRKETAELMLSLINRVPDPLRREFYLDEAANLLKINRRVLTNLVKPPKQEAGTSRRTLASYTDPEERLLRRMVRNTELIGLAVQYLDPGLFPEGEKRDLLERLYELTGKRESFKISEILDLLPDDMRSRVLEWSFLDEHISSREEFARTLADYLFKHRYRALRRELKDAESSGDHERLRRIMAQLVELESKKDKIYQEI
jgi:DNA primase